MMHIIVNNTAPEYLSTSTSRDKKFDLRAASSLESTTREQRVFLIFSACSNPYGNPFPYGVFILSAPSFLKQVWVTPSPHFYCFPSTFSSFLLLQEVEEEEEDEEEEEEDEEEEAAEGKQ